MGQIWDRKFPIPNLNHFRHNIKPNTLRMYKNVYLLCLTHPVMIYHGLWVVCSNLPKYDFLRGDVWTYPFNGHSRSHCYAVLIMPVSYSCAHCQKLFNRRKTACGNHEEVCAQRITEAPKIFKAIGGDLKRNKRLFEWSQELMLLRRGYGDKKQKKILFQIAPIEL